MVYDLAMKMKILPKFYGSKRKLEKPIIELLKLISKNATKFDEIVKELNEKLSLPDFGKVEEAFYYPHTAFKLLKMYLMLLTTGSASYM